MPSCRLSRLLFTTSANRAAEPTVSGRRLGRSSSARHARAKRRLCCFKYRLCLIDRDARDTTNRCWPAQAPKHQSTTRAASLASVVDQLGTGSPHEHPADQAPAWPDQRVDPSALSTLARPAVAFEPPPCAARSSRRLRLNSSPSMSVLDPLDPLAAGEAVKVVADSAPLTLPPIVKLPAVLVITVAKTSLSA